MSMSQYWSSTTASFVISTRTPRGDQLPLMATLLVYYIMLIDNFAMPDILVFRRKTAGRAKIIRWHFEGGKHQPDRFLIDLSPQSFIVFVELILMLRYVYVIIPIWR